MARKVEYKVELTNEERDFLEKKTKSGKWGVREVKRGQILLKADEGEDDL